VPQLREDFLNRSFLHASPLRQCGPAARCDLAGSQPAAAIVADRCPGVPCGWQAIAVRADRRFAAFGSSREDPTSQAASSVNATPRSYDTLV
jgi:hypothetical protein